MYNCYTNFIPCKTYMFLKLRDLDFFYIDFQKNYYMAIRIPPLFYKYPLTAPLDFSATLL